MNCLEFENRLQETLDHRESKSTAELLAHAEICGACHELFTSFMTFERMVSAWKVHIPQVDLTNEILDAIAADSTSRPDQPTKTASKPRHGEYDDRIERRESLFSTVALFISAMAVLVLAGVSWQSSEHVTLARKQSNSQPRAVVAKNPRGLSASPSANERQLDVFLHDAKEAYAALASQALQQASTANFLLPPVETTVPFRNNDPSNSTPQSLTVPLAPWGNELRDAVQLWFDQFFSPQDSST